MSYWLIEHKFCEPRRYAKIHAQQFVEWVSDPLSATRFTDKSDARWFADCARDDGEQCAIYEHMSLSGPHFERVDDAARAALAKARSES